MAGKVTGNQVAVQSPADNPNASCALSWRALAG
jgi:hypothetical protein